jgi:aspartyl-tRNA(Asn)/glutamyl-tRNA(Gln) amidotransferase subunit A
LEQTFSMSSTQLSPVRQAFRAALAEIQQYPIDLDWRPAFMTPITALPRLKRLPLPERTHPALPYKPFAKQPFTLADAARRMTEGSLTAVELAQHALSVIDQREQELNAFVYVLPAEQMLAQAAQLDQERRQGKLRGPLHGITIAVKDVIAVEGMPNTASSPVLADRIAERDAYCIRVLKEAGALITGKTQTYEFALGVVTPQSRNPWDVSRNPGGSSGGSGIAVATGMSIAAMATDTRASVRVPAMLCGVVGYKPTFGIVPTDGMTMLSWSLDHVAHMGATVEDVAILLNVLVEQRSEDYTAARNKDVQGLRIGVLVAALDGAEPDVLAAFQKSVDALQACGAYVEEVATPTAADFDLAVLLGLAVSRCEAAAYHQSFRERKSLYANLAVAEQLDEASHVSAVDYLQAQRAREDLRQRMLTHMQQYDAFLMPTCRVAAPKNEEVDQYFLVLSQNCILWSFIGFPVVSVPCGWTQNGLPVGAQLVAGPLEDGRLLAVAAALEAKLAEQ